MFSLAFTLIQLKHSTGFSIPRGDIHQNTSRHYFKKCRLFTFINTYIQFTHSDCSKKKLLRILFKPVRKQHFFAIQYVQIFVSIRITMYEYKRLTDDSKWFTEVVRLSSESHLYTVFFLYAWLVYLYFL